MTKNKLQLTQAKADLQELILDCKAAALFPPKTGASWYGVARRLERIVERLPDSEKTR